jgi:hypothetical protein
MSDNKDNFAKAAAGAVEKTAITVGAAAGWGAGMHVVTTITAAGLGAGTAIGIAPIVLAGGLAYGAYKGVRLLTRHFD